MPLVEDVFTSLENWGKHPVMREITPGQHDILLNNQEFRQKTEALSRYFSGLGIRERVPVPLFLENSIDFPLVFLALIKLKAVPVMVKMDYKSMELTEIFSNLDPDIVISEKSHISVISSWLTGKTVISRDAGSFSVSQRNLEQLRSIQIPEDVATINYTYRGYGYPLGSMASHSQYLHGAKVLQATLLALPEESMLVILPMSHIFTLIGCIFVPLMYKLTAVIARSLNPRYLFSTIEKHSIQHILSIPEIYELLSRVKSEENTLDSLKVFISGGSYLTAERYSRYGKKFGVEVLHGYGLTEFTPASGNMRGESRPGTIGPLCEGINCLFDEGEILLETPHVTRGYYKRTTETAEAFKGRLFRTGDMGYMENNHLIFNGEKKQTRKINGNIIDLIEIENAIRSYSGTDRFRLEYESGRLTTYISFKNNDNSQKDKLRFYLIDRIARFKVPRIVTGEEI